MGHADYYKPGDWNAICDRCGFKFKASELRMDWQGLMLCPQDWEPRHSQDFVRGVPDQMRVPWTKDAPEDQFIAVCDIYGRSCFPDWATPDCALPDYIPNIDRNGP